MDGVDCASTSASSSQQSWDDFNYPPVLNLWHYAPSELDRGLRVVARTAHTALMFALLALTLGLERRAPTRLRTSRASQATPSQLLAMADTWLLSLPVLVVATEPSLLEPAWQALVGQPPFSAAPSAIGDLLNNAVAVCKCRDATRTPRHRPQPTLDPKSLRTLGQTSACSSSAAWPSACLGPPCSRSSVPPPRQQGSS